MIQLTGLRTHAGCPCPCHYRRPEGWQTVDNCLCAYDGRDEPRPRDYYIGTRGTHGEEGEARRPPTGRG